MDHLRRKLSPLTDAAWAEIDDEARRILETNLSGRRIVDVVGPLGWEQGAVNLGRVGPAKGADQDGPRWALRQVQPLLEARTPFTVSLAEFDNLARGARRIDLDSVSAAAHKVARFEEQAIYHGLSDAGIVGLCGGSEHAPVTIGEDPGSILDAVTRGLLVFHDAGVAGPFALVLGPELYTAVIGDNSPMPLRQQLANLLGAPPIYSPVLGRRGILASTRGGDFELTLGQDHAIGFDRREGDQVHLFLVASFTFRILSPEALVVLA
ncbi:MAG: family 1 encapsulin nanocompartment shell protein [Nannocystaceae bacterium]